MISIGGFIGFAYQKYKISANKDIANVKYVVEGTGNNS